MIRFRLYKKQRLCSPTAIETLFAPASNAKTSLCYPLRAVWRSDPGRRSDAPLAFVVMVPKRRLRHAVDRVCMRRRIREAFRLGHAACCLPEGARVDVAFVYVANSLKPYAQIEHSMQCLLADISTDLNSTTTAP